MNDLTGKIALVTGSTRGIGLAIARGLAGCGARVMRHGRTPGATADGPFAAADLSRPGGAEALYEATLRELGAPDILILNASVQVRRDWTEVTAEEFDLQMHTDLFASLELIRLCAPHMKERRWGRIITIGSTQQVKPHEQMIVYGAAKSAQLNLVRNLALQLAPFGITVNNVAPGTILTRRNADVLADPEFRRKCEAQIPAGFLGEPEDCVSPVLMFCAPESRYLTGNDLFADGGKHI